MRASIERSMQAVRSTGPILIVVAAMLWAFDGVLRRNLFTLPPIAIVLYEHVIGAVLITPFFVKRFKPTTLTGREWAAVAGVSLLSGVLGTLWFTTALSKVNFIAFSVVLLLQKLQPVFAVAAARLILRERITRDYLGWALLALVAAYFVTFQHGVFNFAEGSGAVMASLFAIGAAAAWGASTALSRLALLQHSSTVITGLRFYMTVIFAFIFFAIMSRGTPLPVPDASQVSQLLIIALSTGLVALWIYYQGLKRTHVRVATILELVFPLAAVVIDITLFDTILSPSQYVAAVVLLWAVYRVSRLNKESPLSTIGQSHHQ